MADSPVDKIINSFSDPEQLKMFCESQYREIIKLSKHIKGLDQEKDDLKELLGIERTKVVVMQQNSPEPISSDIFLNLDEADHELIAKLQLAILRNRATQAELTLEEARKVEIYSKILSTPKESSNFNKKLKQLNSDDLMKQLEIKIDGTTT